MYGDVVDTLNTGVVQARLCRGLRTQKFGECWDAGRTVLIEGHGLGNRRAVAQVVRIVLNLQIRIGTAAPRVGNGLGLAAVRGGVVAGHVVPADRADNAAGFLNRLHAARVAFRRAVVYLIAGRIHEVVGRRLRAHLFERIGARRHRLRLERLQREGVIQFVRQNAAHVILHVHVDDDLHIAALGNELDIAGIQVLRLPRLRDAHAVIAAGLVPPELKARAHALRLPVHGHSKRTAAVADGHLRAARDSPGRIPADGVAAVYGQIDAGVLPDGGQIHAHRARDRRALHRAVLRRSRHHRQHQAKQQREAHGPSPAFRCRHVSIPLSPSHMPAYTNMSNRVCSQKQSHCTLPRAPLSTDMPLSMPVTAGKAGSSRIQSSSGNRLVMRALFCYNRGNSSVHSHSSHLRRLQI